MTKRERYERANMRGGLGVRKRLSEESLRETYRLNGVRSGFAVARCHDKYGRWEFGYTVGVIVRKTASIVQIRWADKPEEIQTYGQGDARYEVDRARWRILGAVQGNPLDPDNDLIRALTGLRQLGNNQGAAAIADIPTPSTEETEDMTSPEKQSNAAAERAAAKKALTNGDLKDRETYTAKQVATRCGTDSKTMRKFFRSSASTVEPVGQGGRYEFAASDLPKIKREFDAWRKKAASRRTTPKPTVPITEVMDKAKVEYTKGQIKKVAEDAAEGDPDIDPAQVEAAILDQLEQEAADKVREIFGEDHEPTHEEIEEMMRLEGELDLDDLDAQDV